MFFFYRVWHIGDLFTNCKARSVIEMYINFVSPQQCNRICVFAHILDICSCFHPQYLDYDQNRHFMNPCNLTSTSPGNLEINQLILPP